MKQFLLFLAACIAVVAASWQQSRGNCSGILRQWDAHQAVLMDCREDPDCYITPADLERVRALAPQVQACEAREAGE